MSEFKKTDIKKWMKDVPKEAAQSFHSKYGPNEFLETINKIEFIRHCLEAGQIIIGKKKVEESKAGIQRPNESQNVEEAGNQTFKKKRGRPTRTASAQEESPTKSEGSDKVSLNDSQSSTASVRGRRAAAQAAGQKLALVQNLEKTKKLRRPTDFDEKKGVIRSVSSPPPKARKTHRNQSAGSSSGEDEDVFEKENNLPPEDKKLTALTSVDVKRISTPEVKVLMNSRAGLKRKSGDLFHESSLLQDDANDQQCKPALEISEKNKGISRSEKQRKKLKGQNDSGISSNGDLNFPLAQSSLNGSPTTEVFRGFNTESIVKVDDLNDGDISVGAAIAHSSPICASPDLDGCDIQPVNNKALKKKKTGANNSYLSRSKSLDLLGERSVEILSEKVLRKTAVFSKGKFSEVEVVESETRSVRNRTKVMKSRDGAEEKEMIKTNERTFVLNEQQTNKPATRTRRLGKRNRGANDTDNSESKTEGESENDAPESNNSVQTKASKNKSASQSSEEDGLAIPRSRTKTIRKAANSQSSEDSSPYMARSRTKTIRKAASNQSAEEDSPATARSRTKTIKKHSASVDNLAQTVSQYLASEFKEPLPKKQTNKIVKKSPRSPATIRGNLVKKRVEDYEKIKSDSDEDCMSLTSSGRVTRNAAKVKASTETKEKRKLAASIVKKAMRISVSKEVSDRAKQDKENIPVSRVAVSASKVYPVVEKGRMTPLGTNNRMMTPGYGSGVKSQIKNNSSSTARKTPDAVRVAMLTKQSAGDSKVKLKEEKRMKLQTKEEEAKRKKDNALRSAVEEAKRKREEKHQKVLATKEAAEKEKALLAAKAEQEKQEKLKQLAAEKERQKEEMLQKKKLLMQQKAQEHEERRKQEELARLAKLKEQEEEHKRAIALKEREQEQQKQQKAAELRMAEAEKVKHQQKLTAKVAPNIAKVKTQHVKTPPSTSRLSQNYEITPAREERPLQKPKTENNYGIDDAHSDDSSEDEERPKKQIPLWAQSKSRQHLVLVSSFVQADLWDRFFGANPCMPDVTKIFSGIPVRKRIRTSSAVWRTPPQLTVFTPK